MATAFSAETKLVTTKSILSTAASVAATLMVARTATQDMLPHEIQYYFLFPFRKFLNRFSSQLTIVIDELDGLVKNQIYEAADIYLSSKSSPSTHRLKVSKPEKEKNMKVSMESNEEIFDTFNGVKYKWVFVCREVESQSVFNPLDMNSTFRSEVRSFELSFPKKYKDVVFSSYLPHIEQVAKSIRQETKTIKIFTVMYKNVLCGNWADAWMPVNLDHPATFDTIAMDPEQKETILNDLEKYVSRRDHYRKVGKAWKRGYLLYGPPGTGKSSLIAAMANYLNFDVYDLDLTTLTCNSELRTLLVATANRSILVVEDIDCAIHLLDRFMADAGENHRDPHQQKQVTLCGLLNLIDGLWSSCGDERIIVFTTKNKDKLDPALLRPGRMDVHVHMSYCTPSGFKVLAGNYLGIQDHILYAEIEELIRTTEVTPAEVAEQLMRNDDHETVLEELIHFLEAKKKENDEAKSEEIQE